MFFTLHVLSRKGSLGTIWIAAHLDKKLKRQQISDTDIRQSVDLIMNPEAPFALRLSGQLLFGLARVYKRQVTYLLQDCNDALNKLHHAFVRTTLPEMDADVALKNLTLPEDFFQINETELNQLYGMFPDVQWIEGDDSLIEACIPQEAFQGDAFALTQRGLSYGSGYDMETRELPPLDESIPEEELARDVMRERSSAAEPRMSSFAEAVMDRDTGEGLRQSGGLEELPEKSAVLSGDAMQLMDEVTESVSMTPENPPTEALPILPVLDAGSLGEKDGDRLNAPLSPIQEETEKLVAQSQKQLQKKHKPVIDKKRTTLSKSEYSKMHKETVKETNKGRRTRNSHTVLLHKESLLEQSRIKQVALSKCLSSIWRSHLQHRSQQRTEQVSVNDLDDELVQLDAERNQDEVAELRNLSPAATPLIPEEDRRSTLLGDIELTPAGVRQTLHFDSLEHEDMNHHHSKEPAGEHEMECLPLFQDTDSGFASPPGEFSRVSLLVLSHIKRRFTEEGSTAIPQDDQPDVDGPSPKRRRLSQVVRSAKHIGMYDVMHRKSRQEASRWFYELMVLKSRNLVKLEQTAPYADIMIHDIKSM